MRKHRLRAGKDMQVDEVEQVLAAEHIVRRNQ